jgi:quinol monooxygenase YgiN
VVVYLYRWKLKPGFEDQFKEAWSYVTKELRKNGGSLGSRLHLANDGLYYGYAQWPSREAREDSNLTNPEIDTARKNMREAIEETLPEIVLDPVADFLASPKPPMKIEQATSIALVNGHLKLKFS